MLVHALMFMSICARNLVVVGNALQSIVNHYCFGIKNKRRRWWRQFLAVASTTINFWPGNKRGSFVLPEGSEMVNTCKYCLASRRKWCRWSSRGVSLTKNKVIFVHALMFMCVCARELVDVETHCKNIVICQWSDIQNKRGRRWLQFVAGASSDIHCWTRKKFTRVVSCPKAQKRWTGSR